MNLTVKRLNLQLQKIRKASDILSKIKPKERKHKKALIHATCHLFKAEDILETILKDLIEE